jgi:hypothetical protein
MNTEEACRIILGNKLADSIIKSQCLHWAIVAAIADCKVGHGPNVKAALDAWLTDQRQAQGQLCETHHPEGGTNGVGLPGWAR